MSERTELSLVLDDVARFVRRYVVLDDGQLTAVAIWTLHTHAIDAAYATPYLSITSAEKESGKTRLLEVLSLLVARPWLTGRVTAAVLARKVDKEKPTLLLDESDATFGGDKEYAETLRGILNSGYRASGKASICVGQGAAMSYVDLSTFCAKAIAGIGQLPDTVASRSIPIALKRKAADEEIERFREREAGEEAEPLHAALASLAEYNLQRLAEARPELPEALSDRQADSWEPLFAIGDLAGGEWPERARAAALERSARGNDDDASLGVRLLADCRRAFEGEERLSTKDLIAKLAEDEEAPWAGWHAGSPISPRALADRLHPFGIRSRTVRLSSDETARGYVREVFEDAWRRYLPAHTPETNDTPTQPASAKEQPALSIRHTNPLVSDTEEAANPHEQRDVSDVSDRNGGWERLGASEATLLRDNVARARLGREEAEKRELDARLFAGDEDPDEIERLARIAREAQQE